MMDDMLNAFRDGSKMLMESLGKKPPNRDLEVFQQLTPDDFRALQSHYGEKAVAEYIADMTRQAGRE